MNKFAGRLIVGLVVGALIGAVAGAGIVAVGTSNALAKAQDEVKQYKDLALGQSRSISSCQALLDKLRANMQGLQAQQPGGTTAVIPGQ